MYIFSGIIFNLVREFFAFESPANKSTSNEMQREGLDRIFS